MYCNSFFLLQKRSKNKVYGAGQWSIPGGAVRFAESSRDAAEREVYEETGVDIRNGQFVYLGRDRADDYFRDSWLVILSDQVCPRVKTSRESSRVRWVSVHAIKRQLENKYLKKHLSSFMKAMDVLNCEVLA